MSTCLCVPSVPNLASPMPETLDLNRVGNGFGTRMCGGGSRWGVCLCFPLWGGGVSGCVPLTSTHWSPHSSLHGLGGEPRGPGCSSVFPLCHFCPSLRHFLTKFPELLASPHVPDQDQRDPLFSALAQPRPVTLAPEPRPQLPWGLGPQPPQLRLTGSSLTGWGVVFPSSMGDKV